MADSMAAPGASARTASEGDLGRQVLRVAWMSILLGLLLEVVLLCLAAYAGTAGASPKPFLADLTQKVSWAFIVCVGLAFGSTAAQARSGVMGLLGLISAPAGFAVARSLHKGVTQALGMAAAGGAFPFLVAGLKAIEYGILGGVVGYLTRQKDGSTAPLSRFLLAGTAVGLTFGAAITAALVSAAAKAPTLLDVAGKGINEFLFPIGCSLVLYASNALGKRLGR